MNYDAVFKTGNLISFHYGGTKMSNGINLSKLDIIHTEIITFNNKKLKKHLITLQLKDVKPFSLNPRFSTTEHLTEKEHERKIKEQDVVKFQNLVESIKNTGYTTPSLVVFNENIQAFETMAGSRRYFAAKAAGQKVILACYYEDATDEDIETIRDWPEANETKVEHSNLHIGLNIYNAVERHSDPEKKKNEFSKLKSRFGITQSKIEKFHRITSNLVNFRKERNEEVDKDPKAFKAFESYDSIQQNEISKLRNAGDFDRIDTVTTLIESSIDHNIAHDDFKDSASYLSNCLDDDTILKSISEGIYDLSNKDDLRTITLEVRELKRSGGDPLKELIKGLNKSYDLLLKGYDELKSDEMLHELEKATVKIQQAKLEFSSIEGGLNV